MWGKWVLGAVLLLAGASGASTSYDLGKQSSAFLNFEGKNYCTGTAVGKKVILTAAHCLPAGMGGIQIDEQPLTTYTVLASDEADHVLIYVSSGVGNKRIAKRGAFPMISESIYLWGNPRGVRSVLRIGYVTGYVRGNLGAPLIILSSFHTAPGDSGGGYFNSKGEVVAVHYGTPKDNSGSIALRLQFTSKQWALVDSK